MKDKYKACCFCGKRLKSKSELHNADPLVAPDKEGDFLGCCSTCNIEIVQPARKILWNLDKHEYEEIVPFVQQMSLEELQRALNQDDALSAFYAFAKKYANKAALKLLIGWAAQGFAICMVIAIIFYIVFEVFLK